MTWIEIMKYLPYIFVLILICFSKLILAECDVDKNLQAAVDFCIKNHSTAGFVAAKTTLLSCKNDIHRGLYLKTFMCVCDVSVEYIDELNEICDDVINGISDHRGKGIAWYRKSDLSMFKGDYKKAIIYSEIALEFLSKSEYKKADSCLCWRERYEFYCHNLRKLAYSQLGDIESYKKEIELMKELYKWLPMDFFDKNETQHRNI